MQGNLLDSTDEEAEESSSSSSSGAESSSSESKKKYQPTEEEVKRDAEHLEKLKQQAKRPAAEKSNSIHIIHNFVLEPRVWTHEQKARTKHVFLRQLSRTNIALDEDEFVQPEPQFKQKVSLDEALAAGRERIKKKREEKKSKKEKRKSKNVKNISKAPRNAESLLKELNELASRDADKESVDENGNQVETYFFTLHRKRDLDCYFEEGDLTNISSRDLKRAMRFEPDDLDFAGEI